MMSANDPNTTTSLQQQQQQQAPSSNEGESDVSAINNTVHAHFDCFSGAAGDMMLAACLDASEDPAGLARRIADTLRRAMPPLEGEFELTFQRVLRGTMGSISGLYVTVKSLYQHQPAPVPSSSLGMSNPAHCQNAKLKNAPHHDHTHEHGTAPVVHEHSHEHLQSSHDDGSLSHKQNHCHAHHSHSHHHGGHSTATTTGPLRNWPEIRYMLRDTPTAQTHLPAWVRHHAVAAFEALAEAEAAVHGATSADAVHFHEVGAVDSIVDTVGTLLALYYLQVETVSCSPLPLGEGTVWTAHGLLPVPTPATLRLMRGMRTTPGPPCRGELVTPTAAALLRVLTNNNNHCRDDVDEQHRDKQSKKKKTNPTSNIPQFTIQRVGVGAGTKDFAKHPNILRLILGDHVKWDDESSRDMR